MGSLSCNNFCGITPRGIIETIANSSLDRFQNPEAFNPA